MPKSATPTRRELQAAETRRLILASARRHFAAEGYARTSLKTVAADVGVSVQTIYDSVGAKADLVRRLNDLIDEEAQVGELAGTLSKETDPRAVVSVSARVTRRIFERCGDLVRAGFEGARAEPELAEVAEEGGRRHRAGAQQVAARLAELGALCRGNRRPPMPPSRWQPSATFVSRSCSPTTTVWTRRRSRTGSPALCSKRCCLG